MPVLDSWIADRTKNFDSSGIRRMFDLAAKLKDPINLSIGQPDFPVPDAVKDELIAAIKADKNGYALTQGIPVLRRKLQTRIDEAYGHSDRKVFVCSGTSGGLTLALMSLINPGDEVIYFDPYFVMYPALVELVNGKSVKVSCYPSFQIDIEKLKAAITSRTKMIILNTPSNPTGACCSEEQVRAIAELAAENDICLVSDEIYSQFIYDQQHISPAKYNPRTVVIDGFSKTYAMTGLRCGYVHGPKDIVETMMKVQQFTFVCAPQPVQWASAVALDVDMSSHVKAYEAKRDLLFDGLKDHYDVEKSGGAFYLFPKTPWGDGQSFSETAIDNNLMLIPGNIFSDQDTHFRVSYAASEQTLERGIKVLKKIASQPTR